MTSNRALIVGVGDDGPRGLPAAVLERVRAAEILIGGERHLALFPEISARRLVLKTNLQEAAELVRENLGKARVVVLASGDPLFYGVGRFLSGTLGREKVEVVPHVSAMQVAFARAGEAWEDAALVSVHGRPLEGLLRLLPAAAKIGVFTGGPHTPDFIARALLDRSIRNYRAVVCENLEGEEERIIEGTLEETAARSFAPLNVLLLFRRPEGVPLPGEAVPSGPRPPFPPLGIPDEEFHQRRPEKGLITKAEVRVLALSKMEIRDGDLVWDIGAGSGSVSIEAGRLAPRGRVFAVEKNEEDVALVRRNIEKFGTANVTAVHGVAPDCLPGLQGEPDAVFIGGSGGRMEPLLRAVMGRMREGGRLVATLITFENLAEGLAALKAIGAPHEVLLVQASRSRPILELTRLEALNPIFIVQARKAL